MALVERPDQHAADETRHWRLLVVAPNGKDREVIRDSLLDAGLDHVREVEHAKFCEEIERGAATAVIVEEVLTPEARERLSETLARQPSWSDFPLVIVLRGKAQPHDWRLLRDAAPSANVVLLERPLRRITLVSSVQAALQSRTRQYQVRDELRRRRSIERALRTSEQTLHLAQKVARIGSFEWDIQSGENRWSPELEELYGLEPGTFGGTYEAWREIIHPDDLKLAEESVRQTLQGDDGEFRAEWRVVWPDGSVRWMAARARLFRDDQGRPTKMVGVNLDVTERKWVEQVLRQANEKLENRVAERTQELRERNRRLRALAREMERIEQRERERLSRTLHDGLQQLLVAAKMQAHFCEAPGDEEDSQLKEARESLRGLIDEAIQATRSLSYELSPPQLKERDFAEAIRWLGEWFAENHRFRVELAADASLPTVDSTLKALLYSVVRELLLNCVKYSGVDRARVELRGTADGEIFLQVEDQGKGFEPAAVEGGKDDSVGMGLVAIRHKLAAADGHLKIDSAPGRGARFTVRVAGREEDGQV